MPSRVDTPPGAPCWIDIVTSDKRRACAFYPQLFGWTADAPNPALSGYVMFRLDGEPVAGCMAKMDPSNPDLWWTYLASDSAAETARLAEKYGGVVHLAPMVISSVGTLCYLIDPSGGGIGVWQAGSHRGFTVIGEPGAPSWFELHTSDYDAAVAFYQSVFGWDTKTLSDSGELRYTLAVDGHTRLAGVMDARSYVPGGTQAVWDVYFAVADADATVARAVELGGSVVYPATDSPSGRFAVLRDDAGIRFRIREA